MTITASEMAQQGHLIPVADIRERLGATEPLSQIAFTPGDKIAFKLQPGWNHGLDGKDGTEVVEAEIKVAGVTYQLTKDATLEATSLCGIPRGYVERTPASLIEPHLNYWLGNGAALGKDVKLLAAGDVGQALTRATVVPYSNNRLLDAALLGIHEKYGAEEADVFVDYKFRHSVRSTFLRLVVPEQVRRIESARDTDDSPDNWSTGLQIRNSLTGEVTTELQGYLFAWWCTNGSISTHSTSGAWSRRGGASGGDVFDWAQHAVDEILGGLEHELDAVQQLTDIDLGDDMATTVRDLFTTYKVPVAARERIIELLTESEGNTMYDVQAAITAAANAGDLSPGAEAQLLTIGGDLPRAFAARCGECHRVVPNAE